MVWLSITDPRTATTLSRDYPTLADAMEAACEPEEDGMFIVIEDEAGRILRDTRSADWLAMLNPEYTR